MVIIKKPEGMEDHHSLRSFFRFATELSEKPAEEAGQKQVKAPSRTKSAPVVKVDVSPAR